MSAEVERILEWSAEWRTILLSCGCRWKLRKAEVAREQLYVGKRVSCKEHKANGGES